jgi:hypothetical protein
MEPWQAVAVSWVIEMLDQESEREISTREAADRFGHSPKWWRLRAESGQVEGAYQDEGGRWMLPLVGCRKLLFRLSAKRRKIRGPNRKATQPSPASARPKGLETRPVLERGPAPMERPPLRLEESA